MPTTLKAALKKWEETTGHRASEASEVKLIGLFPPLERIEGPLHLIAHVQKLSLSTNQISFIQNMQTFKNLRVLSLGRNLLKSLQGVETLAETLEQLWVSYNQIDKLKPLRNLAKLRVLYISHNSVREWREFDHLSDLSDLEDLVFIGNPLEEEANNSQKYVDEIVRRLQSLKKLDGNPVIRAKDENENEEQTGALELEEIDRMAEEAEAGLRIGEEEEEEEEEEDNFDEEEEEEINKEM